MNLARLLAVGAFAPFVAFGASEPAWAQNAPVSGPKSSPDGKGATHEPPGNGGPCSRASGIPNDCCDEDVSERPRGGCDNGGEGGSSSPGSAGGSGGGDSVTGTPSFPDGVNFDSVLLQSGQEMWEETDLSIDGLDHGVDIKLMRRHLSTFGSRDQLDLHDGERLFFPMFGPAWSCNYQRVLWRLDYSTPFGATESTRIIHEEAYDKINTFEQVEGLNGNFTKVWDGVEDNVDKVIWNEDASIAPRMWRAGGLELIYSPFRSDGFGRQVARLEMMRSPNGNSLVFVYDDNADVTSPAWHQVSEIHDSFGARTAAGGRLIDFDYSVIDGRRVVTSVTDFDGRTIDYEYLDEDGGPDGDFLSAVMMPVAPDFPAGARATTSYSYAHRDQSEPRLTYNLSEVICPNQNQTGSSAHRAAWTYHTGATNPQFVGAVHTHTTGDPDASPELKAGGTTILDYSFAGGASGNPNINDPFIEATMTTSRGVVVKYTMSYLGQILSEELVAWTQGDERSPAGTARTFSLTGEGNVAASTGLMGDTVDVRYADSLADPAAGYSPSYINSQRSSAGLQTWIKRTVDPGRASVSDQQSIVTETIYEPIFNRPFQTKDARGHVTTYIYDYMEDPDVSIPQLEVCLGYDGDPYFLESNGVSKLRTMFDNMLANSWNDSAAELVGQGDLNGDGFGLGNPATCGLSIMVIHPDVKLPSQVSSYSLAGAGQSGPTATQSAVDLYRYNEFGQPTWHKDPEGNVQEFTYYPDENVSGDPVTDGGAISGVGDGKGGGYLRSTIKDTSSDPSRNSGAGGAGQKIEVMVGYTVVSGQMVGSAVGQLRYTRQRPTTIFDGRGVRHDFQINALDQLYREERATGSLSASIDTSGMAFWSEYSYDANGNVIETRVQDGNAMAGYTAYTSTYDVLNQVREIVDDAQGLRLTTTHQYDSAFNLIEMRRIDSNAPNDNTKSPRTQWIYDERNLVVATIDGVGSSFHGLPNESRTETEIDANGNIVVWRDATGDTALVKLDGFDRVVEITARDGTVKSMTLDPAGNVVAEYVTGEIETLGPGGAPTSLGTVVLESTRRFYDARNREYLTLRKNDYLGGPNPGGAAPPLPGALVDNLPSGISANGEVASMVIFDRLSRPIMELDAEADKIERQFDGIGRPTLIRDALNNDTHHGFDKNGNLVSIGKIDRPTLAGQATLETFKYEAVYDALNRRTTTVQPNGETTRFTYDARDQLKSRIDALGHRIEWEYDALTREIESRQFLRTNTEGGDPNLTGAGAPDGKITISQEWDALSRMKTRTDDRGNVSSYFHDALDRVAAVQHGDGTFERFYFTPDGEMFGRVGQAGELHRHYYDEVGRPTSVLHFYPTGPGLPDDVDFRGSTVQRWAWDGLGRNWATFDDNGAGGHNDVVVNFGYDKLGRATGEQQHLGGVTAPPTTIRYEGSGRVVDEFYPSGRRIRRGYDALDRLKQVSEMQGGTPIAPAIARFEFVGKARTLLQEFGNGTILDMRGSGSAGTINSSSGASNPNDFGYDANGRTIFHEWKNAAGSQVTGYRSIFNGANGVGTGRRIAEAREHLGRRDSYGFDWAYRMTSFGRQAHDGIAQLSYISSRKLDGVDKMHEFADNKIPGVSPAIDRMPEIDNHAPPTENGLNQYSSFEGQTMDYDKIGSFQGTFKGKELRFDSMKRLSRLLVNDKESLEYVYDASGRRIAKIRVEKNAPVVEEQYFYNCGWSVLEERNGNGRWTKQFVDGDGVDEHLQYRLNVGTDDKASWFTLYYHCNSMGFVGGLTNQSGQVAEYVEYSWLGEPDFLAASGVLLDADPVTPGVQPYESSRTGNPYLFQGRRLDPETGLYHFRNRQYDPRTGSFISIDPLGIWEHGQGNGYSAFGGDPWNRLDPYGLSPTQSQQDPQDPKTPPKPLFDRMPRSVACAGCHGTADGSWSNIAAGAPPANIFQDHFLRNGGSELLEGGRAGKTIAKEITIEVVTTSVCVATGTITIKITIWGNRLRRARHLRLYREAVGARNALSRSLIASGRAPAMVTGGYNFWTGRVTAQFSTKLLGCAENSVKQTLRWVTKFTKPVRPNKWVKRTGDAFRAVCEDCEKAYGRAKFAAKTFFKSDK